MSKSEQHVLLSTAIHLAGRCARRLAADPSVPGRIPHLRDASAALRAWTGGAGSRSSRGASRADWGSIPCRSILSNTCGQGRIDSGCEKSTQAGADIAGSCCAWVRRRAGPSRVEAEIWGRGEDGGAVTGQIKRGPRPAHALEAA